MPSEVDLIERARFDPEAFPILAAHFGIEALELDGEPEGAADG